MRAALKALQNAKIVLLGVGKEGISTYRFLREHVPSASLSFADRSQIRDLPREIQAIIKDDPDLEFVGGSDYESFLSEFDVIFRSPGIPPTLPSLQAARAAGTKVTSNTQLFFDLCPGRVIGVTGTKGKSTTASLIFTVLCAGQVDPVLIGNIGHPALSQLDLTASSRLYVAELSSHQLADLTCSPYIAVVHDIVPEHLDYYGSYERYVVAKANIAKYQRPIDYVIYNADSPSASGIVEHSPAIRMSFGFERTANLACTLERDWLVYGNGDATEKVVAVRDVPLRGRFNLLNVMPALIVGKLLGVPNEIIVSGVRQFRGLEHRLELAGVFNGVSFYNDSLATVPEATMAALDSFTEPVVLIGGGEDRGQDFTQLAAMMGNRDLRALVLLPPSGDRIRGALETAAATSITTPPCWSVHSMREAVQRATESARAGDVVLLSPASASHGMFRDYADRGEQFRQAVRSEALKRARNRESHR